jgi:hypothetical protein
VETDRDVEDFLENYLEGVRFAEFCNARCNDPTQLASSWESFEGMLRGSDA